MHIMDIALKISVQHDVINQWVKAGSNFSLFFAFANSWRRGTRDTVLGGKHQQLELHQHGLAWTVSIQVCQENI